MNQFIERYVAIVGILLLAFIAWNKASSQSIGCGATFEYSPPADSSGKEYFRESQFSHHDPRSALQSENHAKHVKIAFHVIRKDNGSTTYSYDEARLDSAFEKMKAVFEVDTIRIQIVRNDTIFYTNNTWLYQLLSASSTYGLSKTLWSSTTQRDDCINVYIMPYTPTGQSYVVGFYPYNDVWMLGDNIFSFQTVAHQALTHELGHALGLFHVFDTTQGRERLTRITSDPVYNANSAGDFCHDTPAHPDVFGGIDPGDSCIYGRNDIQPLDNASYNLQPGNPYGANKPDMKNYMCYGDWNHDFCRIRLSPQQIMQMRAFISRWSDSHAVSHTTVNKFTAINTDSSSSDLGDSLLAKKKSIIYVQKLSSGQNVWVIGSADTNRLRPPELIAANKHIHWNLINTDYIRQKPYLFDGTKDSLHNIQSANFKQYFSNASISTDFEGISNKGKFQFQDPWYIQPTQFGVGKFGEYNQITGARTIPKDSLPYKPKVFKFFPDTSGANPYYALHAYKAFRYAFDDSLYSYDPALYAGLPGDFLLSDIISSVSSSDLLDNGPPQTDYVRIRISFQSEGQTFTLRYKSFLSSRDPYPFSTNSQRHLCLDTAAFTLAYSSNDGIYLTRFPPGGSSTWSAEKKVPTGFAGSHSLDANEGRTILAAADGSNWKMVEYDPVTETFSDTSSFAYGPFTKPVVGVRDNSASDMLIIGAAETGGGAEGLTIVVKKRAHFNDYPTLQIVPFSQAGAEAKNPSLVCDNTGKFHLAWEESNKIFYQAFTVDGANPPTYETGDKVSVTACGGIRNGRKPSITVDANGRPSIAWETDFYDVTTDNWSGTGQSPYRNAIATKVIYPESPPPGIKSISNEFLFPVRERSAYDPVTGGDKEAGDRRAIVWWTDKEGGSRLIHSAAGKPNGVNPARTDWSVKTWADTGYTPLLAAGGGTSFLAVYVEDSLTLGGSTFRRFQWTRDTTKIGFGAEGIDTLVEMRGATLSGADFTNGVAFAAFEDSLTGFNQPFVPIDDTTSIRTLSGIKEVVQTIPFTASRIKLSIRRFAEGILEGTTPSIFDTTTVEWFVEARNGVSDTLIRTERIARLAKDEAMPGIDSLSFTVPRQSVYLRLFVEAPPSIVDCYGTFRMLMDRSLDPPPDWRWQSTLKRTVEQSGNGSPRTAIVLEQNRPNPFNPLTEISFSMEAEGEKELILSIYDGFGREVARPFSGSVKTGRHTIRFDGSRFPSGIYIYRLTSGSTTLTRKMCLVK